MEFRRTQPDGNVTRQSIEPSFSYDLSQVPDDIREIYGYRPRQFREDGRFQRILETLDQVGPNNFLMDRNLEQVLSLKWANDDRSYVQPLIVLTVIDGTAREFALKHFGVPIDDVAQRTYYAIEPGKFFPMPEEQFVRFGDDKTLILSSREFLDAHQIALKKSPNTTFQEVAATMPDAPLWVIANTSDKTFLDDIEFLFGESPLATILMAQLPIWEDTSHLTLALLLGSEPNLQLSAHALAADKQTEITQTLRTLPVTLANLLRATSKGDGPVDQAAMSSLVSALNNAQVTEPSGTVSRATISLKAAEPHLLKLLNSFLDLEQAQTAAYKAASVSNLRQIGLAFELFEQEYGYLPSVSTELPGAKHPVSWRVAILKYLDEDLFAQYKLDEPWDSEHNKKLLETLPSFYQHFSQGSEMPYTCYVTLVGKDTATGNDRTPLPNRDREKTILVIESITDIPWTKPEDFVVTDEEPLPIYRPQPDGWNVLYGNGKVRFIPFETKTTVELEGTETHSIREGRPQTDPEQSREVDKTIVHLDGDPMSDVRQAVLPQNFDAEGAGWERFRVATKGARGGTASGVPENLRPLLAKLPQPKLSLQKLADEVEAEIKQHPQWKAGVAVLGFLEAELGNQERAVKLFEQVLAEKENPITPEAAWIFGLALEGKGPKLDQIVIALYEINVAGERNPSDSLRESAIGALSRLYARYGRRDEAQQLLLRLTEPEGPDVVCSWARGAFYKNRCTECHQQERGLENYILMANSLTDIGSPVEARMSLARIGVSFKNAYDSDEVWAKTNTIVPDWEYQGKEAFQPAKIKAESMVTPQMLFNAFELGVSIDGTTHKTVIGKSASSIDLILGVRGENGKSIVFSPVIDMLALAAQAKGADAAIANIRIDRMLAEAFQRNFSGNDPDQLEVGIAATVFAFLRNDLDAAAKRIETLNKPLPDEELRKAAVGLWLVAHEALQHERTREVGEKLAERALAAAEQQADPLWAKAIREELLEHDQERKTDAGINETPAGSRE